MRFKSHGFRRSSIPPRRKPMYEYTIVKIVLATSATSVKEEFEFTTHWVHDFIDAWLKDDPNPDFSVPDIFLKTLDEDRKTVSIDEKKDSDTLAKRREWKFIKRELDLVESLYALGVQLKNNGHEVRLKVGSPYHEIRPKPMIPSQILVDPRTKKYRLRKQRNRQKLPAAIQVSVWERFGGMCVNCGAMDGLQFDHIIPISQGGSNSIENLQILCASCNQKKGMKIGGEED
ncbi:MAG: HNH endonuclease [Candidatus Thorarchaeota archaeon]|nr:MAG: HNH endonuclease [Candidatus Thorarchaeota archaeon]